MRFLLVASLLLLSALETADAQNAADVRNVSSADEIIEVVQTFCLDTGLNATKAWTAATDAGWVKVPTSVIDPHIWGTKPYHRAGVRSPDGAGL
ncbi:hypothetical protein [Hyphomonas sp.]|jgi:hypothetical protein|uniref:hypothetical protein n=1 Tax=Hyphomonas sp. TaxID=87 RepID=UPI003566DF38